MREELARAKVNLTLHVTGRRSDGYHELDSLVVFPEAGDRLRAEPATITSLAIDGPFADMLDAGAENLVAQAAQAFQNTVSLQLTKTLPIAAGIGGGSADAAAALRLLAAITGQAVPPSAAEKLGADVPVCMASQAARMRGIGDEVALVADLPPFWLLLVNNGRAVPTGPVFAAQSTTHNPPMGDMVARDFAHFANWLRQQRNDLEAPAICIDPGISDVLAALRQMPGCHLARMSGSGGTCFGLFEGEAPALGAQSLLNRAEPGWWTLAAPVVR